MKSFLSAAAAFAAVHTLLFWLFWAGGFDFSERGQTLFWFAYIGMTLGSISAGLAYSWTRGG